VNWRTTLGKIIRRAGVSNWPKPFVNMHASRETELAAEFPIHVVTAWLGNSPSVATKHYLQVTDADFARALRGAAKCGAAALQNAVQQAAAPSGTEPQESSETLCFCGSMRDDAGICDIKEHAWRDSNPQPLDP
jgi:hypothetical protein